MHLESVVAALLFSALLLCGACGGGSGGGSTVEPPEPEPTGPLDPAWTLEEAEPDQVGATQADVDAILDHIFTDSAIQSVVIVKRGYVIGERYAAGRSSSTWGTSWSVAKSFYSAAVGVAIREGHLSSLDQKASDLLDEWMGTDKEDITLRNILEMRAGFRNDAGLFTQIDQTAYSIQIDIEAEPGTRFLYSNNTSQLMEPIIRRATGMTAHEYLDTKIFSPIDIDRNQTGLWFDPSAQNPLTYCCIDMRPYDFARFGLLFARDGEWDGERILPSTYVKSSLEPRIGWYGLQWWRLNSQYFRGQQPGVVVSAALGLDGQKIYVWPEADVVVVVLTKYTHSRAAGFVLSLFNWPDTCTGRNNCPGSTGPAIPEFNEFRFINLLANLD